MNEKEYYLWCIHASAEAFFTNICIVAFVFKFGNSILIRQQNKYERHLGGLNVLSFPRIRACGRSRRKKSNFAGFSGANSRKKTADFAGIFKACFAEKRLVKNGRFRESFPSKFR